MMAKVIKKFELDLKRVRDDIAATENFYYQFRDENNNKMAEESLKLLSDLNARAVEIEEFLTSVN